MNVFYLATEIGGTKLQAALGRPGGEIVELRRGTAPASAGAEAILEWFRNPVRELIAIAESLGGEIRCLGVGFGGPVDTLAGCVLASHQVSGWDGFPLKEWFESAFGIPVAVANDSNAAGWAEYRLGAGRGCKVFMYSNIGSGIGGALVINGRLYDGQGLGASEVGHTLVPDWTVDTPGQSRKLEDLCSGWAIERRLRAGNAPALDTPLGNLCGGDQSTITCAMLGEAARLGDEYALSAIDVTARGVATALANALTLLHPERIAMGGGVSLLGDVLLEPIRRHTNDLVFGPYRGKYQIVPCELGENVVVAGALLIAEEDPYK
jgi:glucokinase